MDWKNVNLKSAYEREQNIIDPLNFDTLLLEISCNCRQIDEVSIRKQFQASLQSKIESAKEVFENNIQNILENAQEYRNIN